MYRLNVYSVINHLYSKRNNCGMLNNKLNGDESFELLTFNFMNICKSILASSIFNFMNICKFILISSTII